MNNIIDNLTLSLERMKYAGMISTELNNYLDLKSTLITVIHYFSELTGCQAVSIRLHKDGDYPYYVYYGFPELFIEKENSLCSKNNSGERLPAPGGTGYMLDCMCGNVIKGRFDPSQEFFSPGGSFWSNHTTHLLATTTDDDRQATTRNYCNSCGYESVALIPIKTAAGNIGLIQLNDYRKGMFDKDLINFLELLAGQVGLAVSNSMAYEDLKKQEIVDSLTGLYKRGHFMDRIEVSINEGIRYCQNFHIMVLDLDNFKSVNELYGYREGDKALVEFADILRAALQKSGTVGRIAGDQFGVAIRDDEADPEQLINRIRSLTRQWTASENRAGQVDVSIGAAPWNHERPISLDELMLKAEQAMRSEKYRKKDPLGSFSE